MTEAAKSVPGIDSVLPTEVIVNPKIFPLDVIYSAAYVFLDKHYIMLDGDPKKKVVVKILPKGGSGSKDIEKEFHNELINYSFYKKQVERNSEIRKAMIQRALATSELSGEHSYESTTSPGKGDAEDEEFEDLDADFIEDPEGIAIPWEEKYGKKGKKR